LAADSTRASGLAGRYAAALFELADDKKELDPVAADLRGLREILGGSEDLQRLIRSPLYSREQQGQALTAILAKSGAGDLARRFVLTVAQNRRLFALPQMIDAFLAELARRRGEVTAEVTSAAPLSDTQRGALDKVLRKEYGDKVQMDLEVDESLIGGLVVRIGSRMIDGSLKSKLRKLEFAMKGIG